MEQLDRYYWEYRWQSDNTGWDIGKPSPAIVSYMEQYPHKAARILIAGCGHAHEAAALAALGFTDITVLDIAETATEKIRHKYQHIKEIKVICEDFFTHNAHYDLLLEQTFFCAIPTEKRVDYVQQAANLLAPNGKLVGLLFNRNFDMPGPPFAGGIAEYSALFAPFFTFQTLAPCFNSIPARAGKELFINFNKK